MSDVLIVKHIGIEGPGKRLAAHLRFSFEKRADLT